MDDALDENSKMMDKVRWTAMCGQPGIFNTSENASFF